MTKTDMVDALVGAKPVMTKKEAGEIVDLFLSNIKATVAKGEEVRFAGFGSFSVKSRKERKGRNPQSGAEIVIAASKSVAFKPGKEFKGML